MMARPITVAAIFSSLIGEQQNIEPPNFEPQEWQKEYSVDTYFICELPGYD